jgi:hypothetical protein
MIQSYSLLKITKISNSVALVISFHLLTRRVTRFRYNYYVLHRSKSLLVPCNVCNSIQQLNVQRLNRSKRRTLNGQLGLDA